LWLNCRLIALEKNLGVRPIGIGEVERRIIAKTILSIIGLDIQHAAGPLHLCAGQMSGVEAAIHAVRTVFTDNSSEGLLTLVILLILSTVL